MKRFDFPAAERPVWYHVLLVMLIGLMGFRPVADAMPWGDTLLSIMGVLVLLACVMAMGRARASRIVAWVAVAFVALLTLVFRDQDPQPQAIGKGLGALIMLMVCWRILLRIFTTSDVTWATISGAVGVFLLLSSVWTAVYSIAAWSDALEPAFHGVLPVSELLAAVDVGHARAEVQSQLSYFSLVTLTTLGYGDISPAHPVTRALASAQAVVGQLYLVVLVARLVSMHAQGSRTAAS